AAKPAARTPDFTVDGAPKEPQQEMPLSQRAHLLSAFIASHAKSRANVRHFLYQNSWIVTGAKFGWWHGAEALRELIAADRAAQGRASASRARRSRRSRRGASDRTGALAPQGRGGLQPCGDAHRDGDHEH